MITQEKHDWALEILIDREEKASKARAAHEFESDRKKVIFAELVLKAPPEMKSQGAKETWAYSHPDYLAHLDHIREIASEDYKLRDRRSAAKAIIDAWQTQSANMRAVGRAA